MVLQSITSGRLHTKTRPIVVKLWLWFDYQQSLSNDLTFITKEIYWSSLFHINWAVELKLNYNHTLVPPQPLAAMINPFPSDNGISCIRTDCALTCRVCVCVGVRLCVCPSLLHLVWREGPACWPPAVWSWCFWRWGAAWPRWPRNPDSRASPWGPWPGAETQQEEGKTDSNIWTFKRSDWREAGKWRLLVGFLLGRRATKERFEKLNFSLFSKTFLRGKY